MKLSEMLEKYGDCEINEEMVEVMQTRPDTIYDLGNGDRYYYLAACGVATPKKFINEKFDKECLRLGNVFFTKKEAEHHKEKLEVEAILRKYSYEFSKEEWEDDFINKIRILYDWNSISIGVDFTRTWKIQGAIYFENEDDANQAMLEVGEVRLAKYLKAN